MIDNTIMHDAHRLSSGEKWNASWCQQKYGEWELPNKLYCWGLPQLWKYYQGVTALRSLRITAIKHTNCLLCISLYRSVCIFIQCIGAGGDVCPGIYLYMETCGLFNMLQCSHLCLCWGWPT